MTAWEDRVNQWFFLHRTPRLDALSHLGSYLAETVTCIALLIVLVLVLRVWLGRWRDTWAPAPRPTLKASRRDAVRPGPRSCPPPPPSRPPPRRPSPRRARRPTRARSRARRPARPDRPAAPMPSPAPDQPSTPGSDHRRPRTSDGRLALTGCPSPSSNRTIDKSYRPRSEGHSCVTTRSRRLARRWIEAQPIHHDVSGSSRSLGRHRSLLPARTARPPQQTPHRPGSLPPRRQRPACRRCSRS